MLQRTLQQLSASVKQNPAFLLRRALTVPALRALIASLVLYLGAFSYCRQRFWRDPHSAFFQSETVYDLHYSLARQAEVQRFIQRANTSDPATQERFLRAQADPLLCAAITTVRREPVQYLADAVGSLLEGLYPEERTALYSYILFANTEPSVHPDWNATWTAGLVDAAETYNVTHEELEHLRKVEEDRNFYVKGVFDYVYALKQCMATTAPFILALEDDIVFADGWLAKTLNALQHLRESTDSNTRHATDTTPWLYLRLFYTETALMWQNTDFWYAHMPLTFLLVITLGFGLLYAIRWRWPSSKTHLDNGVVAVLCVVTIPAFTALAFMIGKYSLRPLRGVIKMNQYGCCTQAMVFPRDQVPALIEFLEQRNNGQTDSMIEEYADRAGLDRFALAPQVVQHVGVYSSRDNTAVNAQSNWAFHFEANDPTRLKIEHEIEYRRGSHQWARLRDFL